MASCTFCGKTILLGTGKLYVKNDGKQFNFCSRRCEKNLVKLGRKARETTWTAEYQKLKKGVKK